MTITSIIGLAAFVVLVLLGCWVMDRLIAVDNQMDKEVDELLRRMQQEHQQRPRVRAGTSTNRSNT